MHHPIGYFELQTKVARVDCSGLEAVRLSGSDAETWLQGQITNDTRKLDSSPFIDFCFVKATGQIEGTGRLFRRENGILILTRFPQILEDRIESFVILEDVVSERLGSIQVSVFGPLAPTLDQGQEGTWLHSPRFGIAGIEVYGATSPELEQLLNLPLAGADAINLTTLAQNVPIAELDIDSKTFPQELGSIFENSFVSYEKGCYFGQEVLQRIHSRGHVNRRWIVFEGTGQIATGEFVHSDIGEIGRVTRSVNVYEFKTLIGAMVKGSALDSEAGYSVSGHEFRLRPASM